MPNGATRPAGRSAAAGEAARCAGIRDEIRQARAEVMALEERLCGEPRPDAPIKTQIIRVNKAIDILSAEGKGLACAL